MIVYDSETWPIHNGLLAPRLVCGQFGYDNGNRQVLLKSEALAELLSALKNNHTIIGHNIAFDAVVSCAADGRLTGAWFAKYLKNQVSDTMLRQRLIDNSRGHLGFKPFAKGKQSYSLAGLVERYCNVNINETKGPESWRLRYCELDGVPVDQWPQAALSYALDDVSWPRLVHKEQSNDYGQLVVVNEHEQAKSAFALQLTSARGLKVNQAKVADVRKGLEQQLEGVDAKLKEFGLMRDNGSRDMAAIRLLVEATYPGTLKLTATGKVPTDSDTLKICGKLEPQLQLLADRSTPDTYLTRYVKPLEAAGQLPINVSYWTLKATGRTSATNPPIQQFPRDGGLRECFEPREGRAFGIVDYSQLELATLAQAQLALFGTSTIAEHLWAGRDLHLVLAAQLLGLSYQQAKEGLKEGDTKVKDARQFAKVGNYGFAGGLGAEKFVEYAYSMGGLVITKEQAQELRSAWFEAFPCMRLYFAHINKLLQAGGGEKGTVVQLYSNRVRANCLYTEACNSYFQGLAADGALDALFCAALECYTQPKSALFGSFPVMFVHDEIVIETPIDRAHEATTRLSQIMVDRMRAWCPDVPIEAEPVVSMLWSKAAKQTKNAEGRLIPWEGEK